MPNASKQAAVCLKYADTTAARQIETSTAFKQIPLKSITLPMGHPGITTAGNHASELPPTTRLSQPERMQKIKWAGARLLFMTYISFAMISLVGGFLSAPLMTKLFYNDWRFWLHWRRGWRLLPHGWKILWMILRKQGQFMFSVPLTSPPQSAPDHKLVELSPSWDHGTTCGSCQQCCQIMDLLCPVLDQTRGFCIGYNSFYWRYFNCGRYPSRQLEIDYYGCNKWQLQHEKLHPVTL
jgi:hypothetical protein